MKMLSADEAGMLLLSYINTFHVGVIYDWENSAFMELNGKKEGWQYKGTFIKTCKCYGLWHTY